MNLLNKYKNMPLPMKASLWFLICAFLQKGISVLTTPIFTRLLSTSEYGQYNVFNSWLGIVTVFVSFNLGAGVFAQGLVKFDEEKEVFASSLQGLTIVLIGSWFVLYWAFRERWDQLLGLTDIQMIAMFSLIWTTAVFNFWAGEQRNIYRYKTLVILTIVVSVAKPLVSIGLILNAEDKVLARIIGLMVVELIGYGWLFVVQMKKGKRFFIWKYWKYALAFNIPLLPHYLSQIVLNSSDRIMINKIVGEHETGIYSLAYSLSSLMIIFNTALQYTLTPWIYKKIKQKQISEIKSIGYLSLIMVALANIILIILAPEVVAIFAPASYKDAIWVIPPIAVSVYFIFSYDLFAKFAFYYEKTKLIMFTSILGAICNLVLNAICIPKWGYMAAGYTTLICYMVYSVGHYVLMERICKKYVGEESPYNVWVIWGITAVFLVVATMILLVYKHLIVRYILIGLGGIAVIIFRKNIFEFVRRIVALKNDG